MLAGKQFVDRSFGFRSFDGNKSSIKDYPNLMKNVHAGWLEQDGDQYTLYPCDGEFESIPYSRVEALFPEYKKVEQISNAWKKNSALVGKNEELYPKASKGYRLVCCGHMRKRNVEYLFPSQTKEGLSINKDTALKFFTVYEQTPDFKKICKYLEEGHRLAVFYILKDNNVDALGLSKYFRYPYKDSLKNMVGKQQAQGKSDPDLSETMFGYTGCDDSLKGRIHIGHAFCAETVHEEELGDVKGVLGQPKSSFYPFYLKQEKNPFKTLDNAEGIAGRKVYRIHKDGTVTSLSSNGNKNVESHFKPIPAGHHFKFKISLHNLRPVETGALLSALTFHGTKNVWHNLGLAKGYGYGKVNISDINLKGLSMNVDQYLREFEKEMNVFCAEKGLGEWHQQIEIGSLLSIHAEHDDAVVKYMSLDEYKDARSNENFHLLDKDETRLNVVSKLTEEDKKAIEEKKMKVRKVAFRKENESLYEEVDQLENERKYSEAIQKIDRIIEKLEKVQLDSKDEQEHKEQLIQKLNELAKGPEKKVAGSLDEIMNERYEFGTNAGRFKISQYKVMKKKTEKYLNDKNRNCLTDEEINMLKEVFKRLKDDPDRKDRKDFDNGKLKEDFEKWLDNKKK
jgi:CRISPR-associated protein (TIGR03986 family)